MTLIGQNQSSYLNMPYNSYGSSGNSSTGLANISNGNPMSNLLQGFASIFAGLDIMDNGQIDGSILKMLTGGNPGQQCQQNPVQQQQAYQPQQSCQPQQQMMQIMQQFMQMMMQMLTGLFGNNQNNPINQMNAGNNAYANAYAGPQGSYANAGAGSGSYNSGNGVSGLNNNAYSGSNGASASASATNPISSTRSGNKQTGVSATATSGSSGASASASTGGSSEINNTPLSTEKGGVVRPINGGRVSSEFGYRIHPISHTKKLHSGIDIAAPKGTPVQSMKNGKVVFAGKKGGYGNTIIVDHGNGLQTRYAHLSSINVKSGQSVNAGQVMGGVGSTGNSTGNHLHFEVRENGNAVNPRKYIG